MKVSDHLEAAMAISIQDAGALHRKWIDVALKFSAKFVGAVSVAEDGRYDILLRKLEDEAIERFQQPPNIDFITGFQRRLSELWVIAIYEVVRTASEIFRSRNEPHEEWKKLLRRLELVRMPITKHQIAKDRKLKEPLILHAVGPGDPDPKPYARDGSYIMATGCCTRTGSVVWWPIDLETGGTITVTRRMLSDEFLALFE